MSFPYEEFRTFLNNRLNKLMKIPNSSYNYQRYLRLCRITIALIKMTSSDPLTGVTIAQMREESYKIRYKDDIIHVVAIKKKNSNTIVFAFLWPNTVAAIKKIRKIKQMFVLKFDLFGNPFIFAAEHQLGQSYKVDKPIDGTEAMLKVMNEFLEPTVGFEEIFAML